MGRMVINRTKTDRSLSIRPRLDPRRIPEPESRSPGIFTAIWEQLGLKLIPTKGPVEMLITDNVERPSQN